MGQKYAFPSEPPLFALHPFFCRPSLPPELTRMHTHRLPLLMGAFMFRVFIASYVFNLHTIIPFSFSPEITLLSFLVTVTEFMFLHSVLTIMSWPR